MTPWADTRGRTWLGAILLAALVVEVLFFLS